MVGLNKLISSGILDNSLIALIITEDAGLSRSVCFPVIILPFGSSSAITLVFFFSDAFFETSTTLRKFSSIFNSFIKSFIFCTVSKSDIPCL